MEEARERKNRLAKMRALLFYHEVKAKRMKKIKSKEYHRKLKKAEKRKALEAGGEADDEEQLRQMMEEAEFERAKERLTLKHKNTSRWARRALKRGTDLVDDGTKAAIAEQLRLGQELRKRIDRIQPGGDDSDASTSASEDEVSDGEGTTPAESKGGRVMTSKAKTAALDLLEGAASPVLGNTGAAGEAPTKGLFALPFMKRALEKRKAQAQEEAKQLLKELEADAGAVELEESAVFAGRISYGGSGGWIEGQQAQRDILDQQPEAAGPGWDSELDADESEDAEAKAQRLNQRHGGAVAPLPEEQSRVGKQTAEHNSSMHHAGLEPAYISANRTEGAGNEPISVEMPLRRGCRASGKKINVAANDGALYIEQTKGNSAGRELPPQHRGLLVPGSRQQFQRSKEDRGPNPSRSRDEDQVSIGPAGRAAQAAVPKSDGADFIPQHSFGGVRRGFVFKKGANGLGYYLDHQEAVKVARQERNAGEVQQHDLSKQQAPLLEEADSDEQDMEPAQANGVVLSQADLVRMAFAGDDVANQFAAEKAEEVQGELPMVDEPGVLPGWGVWAGQQREPKWMVEARDKAKRQRASAAASRKDSKLQYVIISEKWDKKSSKYKTPCVPFPFNSRETYERTMHQPLGKEYNTDASFRNLTRPAVLKDAGVIIEPIRFSKHLAENEFRHQPKEGKRAAVNTISGGMPKRNKAVKK